MNGIDLCFCKIENDEFDEELLNLIDEGKKRRIMKYKSRLDTKLSLFGDLIVRSRICSLCGLENSGLEFFENEHKKPYLKDKNTGIYFNISHTKGAVAAAFSKSETGVDIEMLRPVDFELISRRLAPEEREYILSSKNKEKAFFEIWTKKEAYAKYLGDGLSLPLSSFCVLNERINPLLRTLEEDGYIISVCSGECKNGVSFFSFSEKEAENMFKMLNSTKSAPEIPPN